MISLPQVLSTFSGAPTDAEYAMDLISQRTAAGMDLKPRRRKPRPYTDLDKSIASSLDRTEGQHSYVDPVDDSVDWQKWGGRMFTTKAWASNVKGMFSDGQWKHLKSWKQSNSTTGPGGTAKTEDLLSTP